MWTTLLSLVLPAVSAITRGIAQARIDLKNAETDQEKIHAQERIKELEAKRDVLIKESNTPWNTIARFALMAWLPVYLWWVVINDKIVCKWYTSVEDVSRVCSTDPLSPWLAGLAGVIVGFYFVTDIMQKMKR